MKKCPKCHAEMADTDTICPSCGEAVSAEDPENKKGEGIEDAVQETEEAPDIEAASAKETEADSSAPQASETVSAAETAEQEKKRRRKKRIQIGAAVIACAGILTFAGVQYHKEQVRKATYQEAVAALNEEDYERAEELFAEIPGYKDVADYQQIIENQKVYEAAVALFEAEDYDAAEEQFVKIQEYKDTATYLQTISEIRSYQEAYALYEKGDYNEALQIIEGITLYEPAQTLKETMETEIAYNTYQSRLQNYLIAARAEELAAADLLEQITQVWYNSLYEKEDDVTDPYTKDVTGAFYDSFEQAMANYYRSDGYAEKRQVLEKAKQAAQAAYSALDEVPDELTEVHDLAAKVQNALTDYASYAETLSGTYAEVTAQAETYAAAADSALDDFIAALPSKTVISSDKEETESLSDRDVTVAAYTVQELLTDAQVGDETSLYENFLADYQADGQKVPDTGDVLLLSGTSDNSAYVILSVKAEDTDTADAFSRAFADYAAQNAEADADTDLLLAESESITVVAMAADLSQAEAYLAENGYQVETLPAATGGDAAAEAVTEAADSDEPVEAVTEAISEEAEEAGESVAESVAVRVAEEAAAEEPVTEAAETEAATEPAEESVAEEAETETVTEAALTGETEAAETEAITEAAEESVAESAPTEETEAAETETVTEAAETETEKTEAVTEAAEESVAETALAEGAETETATEAETVTEAAETEETETEKAESVTESAEESVAETASAEEAETETATEAAEIETVTDTAETEAATEETEAEETEAVTESAEESVAETASAEEEAESETITEAAETEAAEESAAESAAQEEIETEAVTEAAEEDETETEAVTEAVEEPAALPKLSEKLTEGLAETAGSLETASEENLPQLGIGSAAAPEVIESMTEVVIGKLDNWKADLAEAAEEAYEALTEESTEDASESAEEAEQEKLTLAIADHGDNSADHTASRKNAVKSDEEQQVLPTAAVRC